MMKVFRSGSIHCLITGALFPLATAGPVRAADEVLSGSIQNMMSPEEFKAAGLNKLSSEQLEKLNAWLQGYREATEKVTEKKTERPHGDQAGRWNGLEASQPGRQGWPEPDGPSGSSSFLGRSWLQDANSRR